MPLHRLDEISRHHQDVALIVSGPSCQQLVPEQLKYGQLYIIDTNEANQTKAGDAENANSLLQVLTIISNVMNNNPYTAAYRDMRTIEREEQDRATLENIPPRKRTMQFITGPDVGTTIQRTMKLIVATFIGGRRCTSITHRYIVVYPLLRQKRNQFLYFGPYRSHGVSSVVPEW